MQEERTFQVKSYISEHRCTRTFRNRYVNSKWLAKKYGPKIKSNPGWKLKDFKTEVNEKYAVDVTTNQCYRAKRKALGEVEGALKEVYAKLWDYAEELRMTNPGSTIMMQIDKPFHTS